MAINPLVQAMLASPRGRMTVGQGLNQAGIQLAQALMAKQQRKKEQAGLEELLGPAVSQPVQSPEQANLISAMMSGAVDPLRTEGERGAMGVGADMGLGMVQDQTKGAMDQRARLDAMIKSGDPQLMAAARGILTKGMTPKEPKATAVTGGYVNEYGEYIQTAAPKNPMDDPSKRYKVISLGDKDQLIDYGRPSGDLPYTVLAEGKDLADKDEVWTDAGRDPEGVPLEQGWVRSPESGDLEPMQRPNGEPAIKVKAGGKQVTGTSTPTEQAGPSYAKQQVMDRNRIRMARKRTADIVTAYKPIYQTFYGKGKFAVGQLLDKAQILTFLGADKYQEYIHDMGTFQRRVNSHVNLYIKEITGAQMSHQEAERLMKAMANLNNSPTLFKANLMDMYAELKDAAEMKQDLIDELMADGYDYKDAKAAAEDEYFGYADRIISSWEGGLPSGMSEA